MNELSTLVTTQLVAQLDHCSDKAPSRRDVERLIRHRIEKLRGTLGHAACHHFSTPGKMLRAKMALHGAALLNINEFSAIRWASAVEVLHNASLIHDDVCDGDKHRRGQQSVWSKFGRNTALALGDWLVALSFEFAAEAAKHSNSPNLVSRLAGHMARTTAGVANEFEWCISQGWTRYLEIAGDKTAPFLTAPTQGVVIMAGNKQCESRLVEYFSDLGKAYQIANDIAEFNSDDEVQIVAGDLAQRRPNAVVLAFADELDHRRYEQFKDWFQRGDNEQLDKWIESILCSGAARIAASKMMDILRLAEEKELMLAPSVAEIVNPVHVLVQRVCVSSTKGL